MSLEKIMLEIDSATETMRARDAIQFLWSIMAECDLRIDILRPEARAEGPITRAERRLGI